MKKKILLAEDDQDLGTMLSEYLKLKNYEVELYRNGLEAYEAYQQQEFHICVLDVMMPEMDGFSLAKKLKAIHQHVSFIFLTAKQLKKDKIQGLQLGADDYITKPFDPEELELRIQNILHRNERSNNTNNETKELSVDLKNLLFKSPNQHTQLTEKEALLLNILLKSPNELIRKDDIMNQLWGEDDYFLRRSLDVFITRLRKILKKEDNYSIKTVRAQGYILEQKKEA